MTTAGKFTAKLRRITVSGVVATLVLLFLYAPITVVVADAFNKDESLIRWGGFTFDWFAQTIGSERVREAFTTSIWMAFAVMILTVIVSTGAALGGRSLSKRSQAVQSAAVYMRIVLPEVVIVVGIFIAVRSVDGLRLGPLWVILAQTLVNAAYATIIIRARLQSMSDVYENASADLGVSPMKTMWRVTLPLLAPSILVGGLMAFTFSLDSVISVVFLGGAATETLPILILGMIRQGVSPEVNAMGVILTVFNLLILAIVVRVVGLRGAISGTSAETPVGTVTASK